jgi:hypothetical protein
MACSRCSKKKRERDMVVYDVLGGKDYLPDRQIRARLEVFKKRHCKVCSVRYECNYESYLKCTIKPISEK